MDPREFHARYRLKRCPWGAQENHLYHFTDRRNLDLIRQHGGLFSWNELQARKIVPPAPGGNEWSHEADAWSDQGQYVHLCLHDEHPMEYFAKKEERIGQTIFLKIDFSIVLHEGLCFTADIANKSGVPVLSLPEAVDDMDFPIIFDYHDWRNPEVRARRDATKKYEALVPSFVPIYLIKNI